MERHRQFQGASHSASRHPGRGNCWRASRDRRDRRSNSRSNARSTPGRTPARGRKSLSPPSVETASTTSTAGRPMFPTGQSRVESLRDRFHQIRKFTNALCVDLEPEDCVVQSMPDVSPTKWHLAHTTWFFETFVLARLGDSPLDPAFEYLFNSYYDSVGAHVDRARRGHLTRPALPVVHAYRYAI